MKHDRYRQALDTVKTPPALRDKTRRRLQKEIAKQQTVRRLRVAVAAAAASAAVFVTAAYLRAPGPARDAVVTPLLAGEHTAQVQLLDGNLFFQEISREAERPLQLSPPSAIRQDWADRYREEFPDSPLGAAPPDGWVVGESGATAYFAKPGMPPYAVVAWAELDNGEGVALLSASTRAELLGAPVSPDGSASDISGVSLAVGYAPDSGRYYGCWEQGGQTVLLACSDLDQEAFVQLLLHYVTV